MGLVYLFLSRISTWTHIQYVIEQGCYGFNKHPMAWAGLKMHIHDYFSVGDFYPWVVLFNCKWGNRFMPSPAVTLTSTFSPSHCLRASVTGIYVTQFWWKYLQRLAFGRAKANQHIYEHKYICVQNWVKFPSLSSEIWCSQGFLVIACCDLDFWRKQYVPGPCTYVA